MNAEELRERLGPHHTLIVTVINEWADDGEPPFKVDDDYEHQGTVYTISAMEWDARTLDIWLVDKCAAS